MHVRLQGGSEHEAAAIAAALLRGGCTIDRDGADICDVVVTLGDATAAPLRAGAIEIDPVGRAVTLAGRALRLSPIEYAILVQLIRARRALTRADLLARIWGYGFDPGTNLVAVHMSRLRAKLGPGIVAGGRQGYRLADGGGAV